VNPGFTDTVTTLDGLRELYRTPSALVQAKKLDHLGGYRPIVEASPFVLIATASADGRCDVSPRGGPPGFVKVLDGHRLAVPDLNGNNLLDSLTNIVDNPHIGLLFIVPGRDETLRIEGRACITTAADVLDLFTAELRRPRAAIGVEIEKVFVHCAKAFRRGRVWDAPSWDEFTTPSLVEVLRCQLGIDMEPAAFAEAMEAGYARDLEADRPA